MTSRMKNPAAVIPEAWQAVVALNQASGTGGVSQSTLALVHLRASQVNYCSPCVDAGFRDAMELGETVERLAAVAAWRETNFFTDAERAALALAEHATRLSDQTDAVPDDVWAEVTKHYDERGVSALILKICVTNVFNRLNVTTKQVAGAWG